MFSIVDNVILKEGFACCSELAVTHIMPLNIPKEVQWMKAQMKTRGRAEWHAKIYCSYYSRCQPMHPHNDFLACCKWSLAIVLIAVDLHSFPAMWEAKAKLLSSILMDIRWHLQSVAMVALGLLFWKGIFFFMLLSDDVMDVHGYDRPPFGWRFKETASSCNTSPGYCLRWWYKDGG